MAIDKESLEVLNLINYGVPDKIIEEHAEKINEIYEVLGKLAEKKPLTIDEFSRKVSELSAIARDFRSDEWDEAEKLSGETIDNADNLEWDAVTCYLDELEEHLGNMKKDKEN
tara:strand:- start:401 stop:739 length:339 start_codon:yes stop_codon:yes gene_type:complete